MFNKKICLLFITLVFMLSVSGVAALDSASVDDIEAGDSEEEPPSGSDLFNSEIISVSQDDYSLETRDISLYYRNGTAYEVSLTKGNEPVADASVIINICGVNYTRVTDSDGKAFIRINLIPGNYSVSTSYCYDGLNSLNLQSDVVVLPTISGNDVVKIYKNDTQYYATFLDGNGNPLVNSDVAFNINGVFYNRKTDSNGIARLNINLNSGEYILTAIHQSGLMCSNLITVLPSISASDLSKFYMNDSQYTATFYGDDGSALVNTEVSFNINGVFYRKITDENGVARLNIRLIPGTYIITAINPTHGEMASNIVTVIPTMIASNVVSDTRETCFDVLLINNDGSVGQYRYVSIEVDGTAYEVATNEIGVACLDLTLSHGIHQVVSTDLNNGLRIYNTINITAEDEVLYYSKYGVSPDGKTIMAIGRPSAPGELSVYGYKFYATTFERVCPYCGSTELYWGIFWAGNEYSNYGVFPATGYREGGSAEGHIFCACCDADWSVFGNEHVYSGRDLTVISQSVLSSKDAAYALKNGEMIYS